VVEYSGRERVQQVQARTEAEKERKRRLTRGWDTKDAAIFAQARTAAFLGDFNGDGEQLPIVTKRHPSRQTRAGKTKDVASAAKLGAALYETVNRAGPTQRALLVDAFDGATPDLRKRTALAKKGRVNSLHGLRKSARTLIDHRHAAHGMTEEQAEAWAGTLILLQVEIAFYQEQRDAEWHVQEIASVLPGYCARVGLETIRQRLVADTEWLDILYSAAARHAVDNDEKIQLPTLITSADIGQRHRVSHVETRYVFPKGGHGIRAYDSTFVPRRKRTVDQALSEADFFREKDEVAKFHGKTRHTVNLWVRTGKYPEKLEAMRIAHDPATRRREIQRQAELERARWADENEQAVTAVTPKNTECPDFLIVKDKDTRDTFDGGVTNDNLDLSRDPDFLRALAAWKEIKFASLRVHRKRGTLAALIEAYCDALADQDAAEAVAAMAREDEERLAIVA
jgi:hypothetical protein